MSNEALREVDAAGELFVRDALDAAVRDRDRSGDDRRVPRAADDGVQIDRAAETRRAVLRVLEGFEKRVPRRHAERSAAVVPPRAGHVDALVVFMARRERRGRDGEARVVPAQSRRHLGPDETPRHARRASR